MRSGRRAAFTCKTLAALLSKLRRRPNARQSPALGRRRGVTTALGVDDAVDDGHHRMPKWKTVVSLICAKRWSKPWKSRHSVTSVLLQPGSTIGHRWRP